MISKRTVNIFILSLGFMVLFISFQTMSNILLIILNSMRKDNINYTGDAYIALAIIYVFLAVSNFLAPSVITLFGTKLSLILGSLTYVLYVASFLIPRTIVLYIVSATLGFGAAIVWIAQGALLTENSDLNNLGRNAGIFWTFFQCSALFGNLFVYVVFQGKDHIDADTRTLIFITLSIVGVIGTVIFMLLRRNTRVTNVATNVNDGPLQAFKNALTLFFEKKMLFLIYSFWFTGVLLSFAASLYGPYIGFTKTIADKSKPFVGLSGVFLGLGEVIGGMTWSILGKRTIIWGRSPIVGVGCGIFLISFTLIFLNIPDSAAFGDTSDMSLFHPPIAWLAILCSFLLGFGDSSFNTQLYSIIGELYKDNSPPAFAVLKLIQSLACGIGLIYSKFIGLHFQLSLLSFFLCVATVTFFLVERLTKRNSIENVSVTEEVSSTHRE